MLKIQYFKFLSLSSAYHFRFCNSIEGPRSLLHEIVPPPTHTSPFCHSATHLWISSPLTIFFFKFTLGWRFNCILFAIILCLSQNHDIQTHLLIGWFQIIFCFFTATQTRAWFQTQRNWRVYNECTALIISPKVWLPVEQAWVHNKEFHIKISCLITHRCLLFG